VSNIYKRKYWLSPVIFQRLTIEYLHQDYLDNKNDGPWSSCILSWKRTLRFACFFD